MAVVNANYTFLLVNVGTNGRASGAGVFSDLQFFEKLKKSKLCISDLEPLACYSPNSPNSLNMPYVFVFMMFFR